MPNLDLAADRPEPTDDRRRRIAALYRRDTEMPGRYAAPFWSAAGET